MLRNIWSRPFFRCAIEDETGRDLEHGSGSSVDILTPLISGDFGNGIRIETKVRRIAERIPIPAPLIHVGRPIRSDAPATLGIKTVGLTRAKADLSVQNVLARVFFGIAG